MDAPEPRLVLDVSRAMAERLPDAGLSAEQVEGLQEALKVALADLATQRESGEVGFWGLPTDAAAHDQVAAAADRLAGRFENVVVLGIGGSSLGPRALVEALAPPLRNLQPPGPREGRPRLFFCDNVDPEGFGALLDLLPLTRTGFLAISKSGSTAETAAQLQVVWDRLGLLLDLQARDHLIAITDPEAGPLREMVRREGLTALPIPPSVGGRYSVLTPVGLLPAALAGIDIGELLAGAAAMAERCGGDEIWTNPAALLAGLLHLHDREQGRPIHVFMAYSDALAPVSAWHCQLWAESLGKRQQAEGQTTHVGPTPVAAVGATDQHSQLQLYLEGPADKVVVLLGVERFRRDVAIPAQAKGGELTEVLAGHSLGELLHAEQRATTQALAKAGRPSISITLPAVTPRHLGELLFLLEAATAIAGGLYGVNPFDQPGVEQGKRYTWGLLGRDGFEDDRAEVENEPAAPERYRLG